MPVVSRMLQVASPDYLAQGKCERSCLLAVALVHTCCSCVQLVNSLSRKLHCALVGNGTKSREPRHSWKSVRRRALTALPSSDPFTYSELCHCSLGLEPRY